MISLLGISMERRLDYEKHHGYLKNHWPKHMLVWTHFDAFFMLISKMDRHFNNFDIFDFVYF